jgi:hypothetical protein
MTFDEWWDSEGVFQWPSLKGRAGARAAWEKQQAEIDALARFKAYVHQRLDAAGIPTHPDGPHSKEGCRVGDRLDLVLGENSRLRSAMADMDAALRHAEAVINGVWYGSAMPALSHKKFGELFVAAIKAEEAALKRQP